jgi:hypothetical protein
MVRGHPIHSEIDAVAKTVRMVFEGVKVRELNVRNHFLTPGDVEAVNLVEVHSELPGFTREAAAVRFIGCRPTCCG